MLPAASARFIVRPLWVVVIAIAALVSLLGMASRAQAALPGAESFGIEGLREIFMGSHSRRQNHVVWNQIRKCLTNVRRGRGAMKGECLCGN